MNDEQTRTMLIDDFLPEYQITKRHQIIINAPVNVVYETLLTVNMARSILVKLLFKIRGLPHPMLTLNELQRIGFTCLGKVQEQELLLGLVGRFWTIKGDLQPVSQESFKTFHKNGFAKAVWNFSLEETDKSRTVIRTETRIQCLDKKSYYQFRLYWFLVGPFSSLIRKIMLKIIKKDAEALQADDSK